MSSNNSITYDTSNSNLHVSSSPVNTSPLSHSPSSCSSASSASVRFEPDAASNCTLLKDILIFSWPMALAALFEGLPNILITSLVSHADPNTALPHSQGMIDDSSVDQGARVVEAYGLALAVYDTAAFAFIFGLMCGLDSVGSTSVGLEADASSQPPRMPDSSPILVATNSGGNARASPITVQPSASVSARLPLHHSHSWSQANYLSLDAEGMRRDASPPPMQFTPTPPPIPGEASEMDPFLSDKILNSSHSLLGLWVKRCLQLELIFVACLSLCLYLFCAPMLHFLGEPDESIPIATAFVNRLIVGLPFVAVYFSLNRGLQACNIVKPVLLMVFIIKLLMIIAVCIVLFVLQYSILAVAWLMSLCYVGQAGAVYFYMHFTGITEQWWPSQKKHDIQQADAASSSSGWKETLHGIWAYSIYAFPASLAISLEFILFSCQAFLAGLLPNAAVELSVHILMFTVTFFNYSCFSGISAGVSVLVGQKLGESGGSRVAHRTALIGLLCCVGVSAAAVLFLSLQYRTVAHWLTSDQVIYRRLIECVPVLIAYQVVDGLNCCSTQLLRTLGVQRYSVILHFTTYYLCGCTFGALLAFKYELGVAGLWIGLTTGIGLNALISSAWLWVGADWHAQSDQAIARSKSVHSDYEVGIERDKSTVEWIS